MFFNGSTYSYHGQTSPTSPTRSSVWTAVCTPFKNTQMPLQDITLNQTPCLINGSGTNAKSPGKIPAPGGLVAAASITSGGRTMKDYEDQLGALQKENFQLKLRIYFLEEKMGILGLGTADENAVKKNIELKVEIEALKKELIEKQELLRQAAKAFELHEEQKEISSRNQVQYEQTLENERRRISQLESELKIYKERVAESSLFYEETCGITPEIAIGNKEKLQQMEEFVESLEAEVRQLTSSLEDERTWGKELEIERDELRDRIKVESRLKGKVTMEKDAEIKSLREKIKTMEGEAFIRESATQQYKTELSEKDRLIEEKISLLAEKCRVCNELNAIADKRKKQVDQFRASLKSRDDALAESNNKYRILLNQFENNHRRLSPLCGPPVLDDGPSVKSSHRSFDRVVSPSRVCSDPFDWENTQSKSLQRDSEVMQDLRKELEERDRELERQDEAKKQLILKLCNVQKVAEKTENELKKLRNEHEKALKMIQEFIARQQRTDEKQVKKEHKLSELQQQLKKKSTEITPSDRNSQALSNVRDVVKTEMINDSEELLNQQCSEHMEAKIDDLQYEIQSFKGEKIKLEERIQCEAEELRHHLHLKEQEIERMVCNQNQICGELNEKAGKIEQLEEKCASLVDAEVARVVNGREMEKLSNALLTKDDEIDERDKKIEELSKELQVKTQNLQQLVNTELWSRNKEIAELHNHMTTYQLLDKSRDKSELTQECFISQLEMLVKHLGDIGIGVKFNKNVVQLCYVNDGRITDVGISSGLLETLSSHNVELGAKADFLKWLRAIPEPDNAKLETSNTAIELKNAKEYCELLRTHVKDLAKFLKRMKEDSGFFRNIEQKKLVLDLITSSKILSEDLVQALDGVSLREYSLKDICMNREGQKLIGGQVEIVTDKLYQLGTFGSAQSDSETFSEPDRIVSTARIGLQDVHPVSQSRLRRSYHTKTSSDSEDSIDYIPCYKTYQSNINEIDASYQIKKLRETNNSMLSELSSLRNELEAVPLSETISDQFSNMFNKLQKSHVFCEKLQRIFEKKAADGYSMKKEKLNNVRKTQLEKKISDVENMAVQIAKQKCQLLQYKENTERKTNQMIVSLNMENDSLRLRLAKLEAENESAQSSISIFSKDLDRLTLAHSQVLAENTKLMNDKLRIEKEMRKSKTLHELETQAIQEKFAKVLTDLNSVNELQRVRIYELETVNKELGKHVIYEVSDSAPSSSGISSVPTETNVKQPCGEIMRDFNFYNGSRYWLPSYPSSGGRSKSSCSPDLGIESDGTISTARPLKDTLKITESMTNLLSDEERSSDKELRNLDGLDEVDALKKENDALKRRLMKTRRALEDTFEHLSTSNKNKKNVEKAITKQLMVTKSILKKTRIYEESFGN